VDVVPGHDFNDPRVQVIAGDIADSALLHDVIDADTSSVFHLAAVVSGQAEADFDLGMRINLDASRQLLEACRRIGSKPKVVFTSSVAVYGGRLPEIVRDDTALNPQSSYGVQKAIGELLLKDYSRKGFVDGRVLRLPTISVRPGRPNKAASSFASGIIREPLNGEEAVCPVAPDTRLWLLSPRKAIDCLVAGHELDANQLGDNPVINLPGISVTVSDMLAALARVAGPALLNRIRWEPDATVSHIVGGWPGAWDVARALSLGLTGDTDFDSVVKAYIEDDLAPDSRTGRC
jgi:nucleoside-diphosphate-sugar epimerase